MTSAVPATPLILWLAVALGGALGALARYSVSIAWMPAQLKFPVATLTVNVLGSFLMGVFYVVIVEKAMLAPVWRLPPFLRFQSNRYTCGKVAIGKYQLAML